MNRGPWKSKYRPDTVEGYVWTDDNLKNDVTKWINDPFSLPHLILTGTAGLGKTTLSNIISNAIAPDDTLFVPASLSSGVETIRSKINDFCTTFSSSDIKIVIFDEAEKLSKDAQEALRNIYDTYEDNVRFIMTCNDDSRIIDPLLTRSIVIKFEALDNETFIDRLIYICEQENIELSEDNIAAVVDIVDRTYPNLRDAINQLQHAMGTDGNLRIKNNSNVVFQTMVDSGKIDIALAKEHLSLLTAGEIENLYPGFYNNIVEYSDISMKKIILISKYLVQHKGSSFPDINFCAFLIELIGVK